MSMELSPHGREQESSSEAIAAFEGIALFGEAMMNVFKDDTENLKSARLVRNVGEMLTSMEVQAAKRFWHVWGEQEGPTTNASSLTDSTSSTHINTYPSQYKKKVVGMMHDTMASFQTWFAPQDVVSYGIQLIPFTSVAQRREIWNGRRSSTQSTPKVAKSQTWAVVRTVDFVRRMVGL